MNAREAYTSGAPTYDAAHNVIANNESGGAGYFAEAHHTASLNIDANYKDVPVSADRLGSTAFGSPDIRLNNGDLFNPKFYATAGESYGAGAQLVGSGVDVTAKYAGQTIIVPSDQLQQAQHMHQQAIAVAMAHHDVARTHALQSVSYDDHIHHGGVESQRLSYAEAHAGAEEIRNGYLPDYVGADSPLLGTGGEGALLAASIALATTIGPQLVKDAADVFRRKLSPDDAKDRIQAAFSDARTKSAVGWALGRGGAAAAATTLEALDPIGAALLVNLVFDIIQLTKSVRRGELDSALLGKAIVAKVKDRISYTTLTAGAVWLVGPLGLLVPIIVRRMVSNDVLQREALQAWHGAAGALRDELNSRIKGAALLNTVGQHYRSADASSKASQQATRAIASDLSSIRGLLGYTPQPVPSGGSGRAA